MRRVLRRLAVMSALYAVLVLAVPMVAVALWRYLAAPEISLVPSSLAEERPLLAIGAVVFLATLGVWFVARTSERRARSLAGLMDCLVEQAEAIGTGRHTPDLGHTGIDEIDRLATAIRTTDRTVMQALTSERQFAADASHQLRTPLTALGLRLEEIALTNDIEEARAEAEAAIGQLERLTRVTEDLRHRSASRGGEARDAKLDAILAALVRDWQAPFERERRAIRVGGERGLTVRGSASMLSQVLATLLENSLKHGAGTVEIDVRRNGPSVVIEVGDHGPGVDALIAPRIFERNVTSGQGTGIGLGVARGLAEASGGRLELLSARPVKFGIFLSEAGAR